MDSTEEIDETRILHAAKPGTAPGFKRFFLKLGGVLAIVLHPVFLFFYCFLFVRVILFNMSTSGGIGFLPVVLLTVCFPVLFALFYGKDFNLSNLKKRPLVLLFTVLCYALLYYLIVSVSFYVFALSAFIKKYSTTSAIELSDHIYLALLLCLMAGMVVLFFVSLWYKISLHANGAGFLLAIPFVPGMKTLLDNGTIGTGPLIAIGAALICVLAILLWQRVASGAHGFWQVSWGLCCGFGVTLCMGLIMR